MHKEKLYPSLIIIFFVVIAVFVLMHSNVYQNIEPNDIRHVMVGGVKLKVELALTSEEHAQGLSGREGLNEDEGMLFIFDRPGRYYFWMKDMNFPIDMIWLAPSEGGGGDARVIYIKKDAQPGSYPESYGSDFEAKYILEVKAGFSDKNNLKAGDSVLFL